MRILGIDIGSQSIKAVEVDSAFGRYEIHEYHEQKVDLGASPIEAAKTLISKLPKAPDRISVAIKTSQSTFRNLDIPTRDKKAIQSSVAFELEDDIPFTLENAVYDYSTLSQIGNLTRVHVSAVLKKNLEATISPLKAANIDPDVLTTEAWALRALTNKVLNQAAQDRPVLVAKIGHQRTILFVQYRGAPVVSREIAWGGRDLTTAISRRYGITVDQAEQAKLDRGFVLSESQYPQATSEQIEFSDAILEEVQHLIQEMRQAEFTCKNTIKEHVGSIYLLGGTSLLPGLVQRIEEELRVPTQPLLALSALAASGVTYSEHTDASFAMAAALALCLVGPEKNTAINFRKGFYSKTSKSRDINLGNLRKPLLAAAAVIVTFFTSMTIESMVYHSQLDSINTQLEKSIRSFFGGIAGSALRNYMANTSSLRNSVNKELNKTREQAKLLGSNPRSPLGFLKDVSQAVPKDVVVDLTRYQVGASAEAPYSAAADGTATLTFYVSNPQFADRLSQILSSKLSGLQKSNPEEVTSPEGGKRWKVTLSGKPTEDSYGK